MYITDKKTVLHIIGGLMQNPSFLAQVDKYNLTIDDFPDIFTKKIFGAIVNLYSDGAKKINPIDVENALSFDIASSQLFEKRQGIDYLNDAIELTNVDNFEYYYKKIKKINLLNDLHKTGIDINQFYVKDLTDPKAFDINKRFEELTIKDILDEIKKKLLKVEAGYAEGDVTESSDAFTGVEELLENLAEGGEIGEPIQGEIFNQVVGGASFGKLYIRSGGSGVSKTRQAVGDACYLAYPIRYDHTTCQWVNSGNTQKVLFIATEQNKQEIQKMILAYITGLNESKFKYNTFTEYEKEIVKQAVWVMEKYKDNFIITRMPNPTIELVKTIVRENCIIYGCDYVFYDYIFIGPSLLNEFRGFNLRNDEVLLMFATALKDLAVELNVFVMTSTQLNSNGDNNQDIRNESALAGGRSTINKADVGAIMARPKREELEIIQPYIDLYGKTPNIVTDIYKVRSGEFNQVRIWSYVDLGTLRKEDLFITNSRFEAVEGFVIENIVSFEENNEELKQALEFLNA